jgi:CHAD domain-containing protein
MLPAMSDGRRNDLTMMGRQPAAEAAIAALQRCWREIEATLPGVRADQDDEALHALRVLVRRSRAILGQFRGALAPDSAKRLAKRLRWLGRATGLPRDLDVLVATVDRWSDALEPSDRAAIAPLRAQQRASQQNAHEALTAALLSPRVAKVAAAFAGLAPSDGPAATAPAAAYGAARCALTLRRLEIDVARIDAQGARATDTALHALRLVVKKARYRLQLQRELSDATHGRKLLRDLGKLQAALGRLQDAAVSRGRIAMMAGLGDPHCTVASGRVLERIDRDAQRASARARGLLPSVRDRVRKVSARLQLQVDAADGASPADSARSASCAV